MTNLEIINNKIFYSFSDFEKLLNFYRFKEFKIVFTNGCFDIMHLGHVDYLSKSADLGDKLIIGLNSDSSVRKIKGEERPITDIKSRSTLLASLSFVDTVIIFEEETPEKLINFITPDILVKGNDYNTSEIIGAEYVLSKGGEVKTIDLVKGYSTSCIIEKIKKIK